MRRFDLPPMTAAQSMMCRLANRNRGQAPSHICIASILNKSARHAVAAFIMAAFAQLIRLSVLGKYR